MNKRDTIKRLILQGMENIKDDALLTIPMKVSMEDLQDAQATDNFDAIIDGLVSHVADTVPDNAVGLISKIEITRHVDEDTFSPVFSANIYVEGAPDKRWEEEEEE